MSQLYLMNCTIMDTRRKDRYKKQNNRFKNHRPRTQKDATGPRKHPAENKSGGRRNRNQNSLIANDTVTMITGLGIYRCEEGTEVDLSSLIATAIGQSITYTPDTSQTAADSVKISVTHNTEIEVEYESTLAAARRLSEEHPGKRVGVLNFASAKNPGGGFLNGSMAQEEELASASALYVCIKDSPMYAANTADPNNCLYQHYMIYSPDVPVFRDNDANYIPDPYLITILTVPAVNAGVARKKDIGLDVINATTEERMDRLLAIAVWHQINVLILGSWGCGVFGGDIQTVAKMFIQFLTGKYEGAFCAVSFSTLDESHVKVFEQQLDHAFR